MWSVLTRLGQLVGLVSSEPPIDVAAITAVLEADDDVQDEEEEKVIENNVNDGVICQHRVGIIASLYDKHGYIRDPDSSNQSDQLMFKIESGVFENLKVGNRVVYLAFKTSEDSEWVVRKILYVQNEYWDKNEGEEETTDIEEPVVKEECETAYKNVIAKVTGREGRTVLAGDLQFSLDSVQIDFLPVEGDWLVLQSLVQTEREADTLLTVHRVSPLRAQTTDGSVSHWTTDGQQGIINSEVVFVKDACEPGYLPRVGDQVRAYSIESEQGQLTWRAVHVIPTFSQAVKAPHSPGELARLLKNKQGIVVTEDTNCGLININQEKKIEIFVKNESSIFQSLLSVELPPESQFKLVEPLLVNPKTIYPGRSLHFVFNVTGRFVGRTVELVVFKFDDFDIGRQLAVDVQSSTLMTLTNRRGNESHQKREKEHITSKKLLATRNGFIVPGVKPVKPACFVPVSLGMFPVPEKLMKVVLDNDSSVRREEIIARLADTYNNVNEPLTPQNYVARWALLIHLEEIEHRVNICRFNTRASLRRVQDFLSLEIPGLAERRPSLITGDRVIAREAWTDEHSWGAGKQKQEVCYEGFIFKVLSNEILIKFSPSFHETCAGIYSISFEGNRTSFRREHQAINLAFRHLSADWLFASKVDYKSPQVIISDEENFSGLPSQCQLKNDTQVDNEIPSEREDNTCFINANISVETQSQSVPVSVVVQNCKNDSVKNYVDKSLYLESKTNDCDKTIKFVEHPDSNLPQGDKLNNIENCANGILKSSPEIIDDTNKPKKLSPRSKVSAMLKIRTMQVSEFAVKDEVQHKASPPRVPVIERFLQKGNCSAEKSPKDVKNMLQQLANLSPSNKTHFNQEMKTVDEIEKSMLNSSARSSVLDDIKPLPKKMQSESKQENVQKFLKNELNDTTKVSRQEKIQWNSKDKLKFGKEIESNSNVPCRKTRKIRWFNPLLNHHQKEAVRNILKGEARPLPYVIFGPPGTGKTITVVEAVLQIYFLIPESRLLIGTPSNSSADLVSERLLDSGLLAPGDLLRLMGHHYSEQGRVSELLQPYCGTADIRAREDYQPTYQGREGVVNVSRHAIGRHRITVGTCNTLAVLYQMGFPRGHFTHVLVDEAGQATEPEILIPLVFLHSSYGQAVLAGDPLQLGPVVMSKLADHFGMGESLLSRLLARTPYLRDRAGYPLSGGYNPHLVTRLVYNYRSLPQILGLPNRLFYDGDLVPQVSEDGSAEACLLASLGAQSVLPPREGRPPAMVFHGVRGTNCQDADSPSWHNPHEAVQTAMYLQKLYAAGLGPDDCGIITPYQAQVFKIRHVLETLEIPAPKIGSVEEFQGQERMAVILSTVRSSPRLIETDVRHAIGFVACPRRLNVAITRARAVLIIIGNPHLLARDQYWRSVLSYCVHHHGYTGSDKPPLEAWQE